MKLFDEDVEQTRVFDDETGEELPESLEKLKDSDAAIKMHEAEILEQMCATPGWTLLKETIVAKIDQYCSDLIQCTELSRIRRLQERIQACQAILGTVEITVAAGRQIAEERNQTGERPDNLE